MSGHAGSTKQPPYSVYSERLVLHALVDDPDRIDAVRAILPSAEAFFRPEHARLYAALLDDPGAAPDPAAARATLGPLPAGIAEDPSLDTILRHAAVMAIRSYPQKWGLTKSL